MSTIKNKTITLQDANGAQNNSKAEIGSNMNVVIDKLKNKAKRMRITPTNAFKLQFMALLQELYPIAAKYLSENSELELRCYGAKELYKNSKPFFDQPNEHAFTRAKMAQLRSGGCGIRKDITMLEDIKYELIKERLKCRNGIYEDVYTFFDPKCNLVLHFRQRDVFYMIWKLESIVGLRMKDRIAWYPQPQGKAVCEYDIDFMSIKKMSLVYKIVNDVYNKVTHKYQRYVKYFPDIKSVSTTFDPATNILSSTFDNGEPIFSCIGESEEAHIEMPAFVLGHCDIKSLYDKCQVRIYKSTGDSSLTLEITNESGVRVFSKVVTNKE